MHGLLLLFTDILLRRRGPQDVPVSRFLDGLTWATAFLVSAAYSALVKPDGPWLLRGAADVLGGALFTFVALSLFDRPARFRQTYTAQCGVAVLLTVPAVVLALLARIVDPSMAPVIRVVFWVLFVATLVVTEHIFRQALDCKPWVSVPVTLANLLFAIWLSKLLDGAPAQSAT